MVSDQEFKDLRNQLKRLEEKVDFLYKHLGVTFVLPPPPPDDPRIVAALKKGDMMEAIRIHRELFETSVADAKQALEEIKQRLNL